MPRRPLISAIALLWGAAAASSAWGLGFGTAPQSTVLGAALDLAIPLYVEHGEVITPGCVSAEVRIGDRQLPKGAVQTQLSGQGSRQMLHVRTVQSVNEPVVSVLLNAGCSAAVQRSFVVLADPQPIPAVPASALAEAPAARVPLVAESKPAAPTAVRKKSSAAHLASAPHSGDASSRRRPDATRTAPSRHAPRLQLDAAEAALPSSAAAAGAARVAEDNRIALLAARSAALAAQQAASAASRRLDEMNAELHQLRDEAAAQQATTLQLRERLAAAQQPPALTQALVVLLALLGAATAGLAWRLRAARREQRSAWHQLAAQPTPSALQPLDTMPDPAEPAQASAAQAPSPGTAMGGMDAVTDDAALIQLQPMRLIEDSPLEQPLAVEDLIDLEQQAEFFIMLGQDAAAIDLLVSHLRTTGGTSPLPYLKLLEIYKRGADRKAYERTRGRFNRRFNAYAPQWDAVQEQAMSLLDYPLVTAALQAVWARPLDAMAELQTLLFRKNDAFELPAYHDLLVLYALARDLHSTDDSTPTGVDVLLPLLHGPDETRLTEALISSFSVFDTGMPDDRPTAPVDLDLNDFPPATETRHAGQAQTGIVLSS